MENGGSRSRSPGRRTNTRQIITTKKLASPKQTKWKPRGNCKPASLSVELLGGARVVFAVVSAAFLACGRGPLFLPATFVFYSGQQAPGSARFPLAGHFHMSSSLALSFSVPRRARNTANPTSQTNAARPTELLCRMLFGVPMLRTFLVIRRPRNK